MRAARGGAAAAVAIARPGRQEAPEERPALELVAKGRSRRLRLAGLSTVGLLFGSMLGLAAFHAVLVQGQLHMDRLDSRITEEQQRQTELRLQVAQLGAPQRIVVAAGDLGMIAPDSREYLAAVVPGTIVPPPVTTKAPKTPTTTAATVSTAAPASAAAGTSR